MFVFAHVAVGPAWQGVDQLHKLFHVMSGHVISVPTLKNRKNIQIFLSITYARRRNPPKYCGYSGDLKADPSKTGNI